MFGSVGMPELLLIMLVVLLLFGSKKLPEIARGLGKGLNEFKKAVQDLKDDLNIDDIDKQLKG